jgi:hypothetical protein
MLEPVVDGIGGDTEFDGSLLDADRAVLDRDGPRAEDLVGVADSGDATGGERLSLAGGQTGGGQRCGDLAAGVVAP